MRLRYLFLRNGWYQYRRYIPDNLRNKFGKREFVQSLRTRDRNTAGILYAEADRKYEALLRIAKGGKEAFGLNAFPLSAEIGLQAIADDTLSEGQIEQFIENVVAVRSLPDDSLLRAQALSSTLNPRILISDIYEKYLETIRDKSRKWTKREKDKALNPILLAIKEWVELIGDVDVQKLKKEDGIRFKNKLLLDVEQGRIQAGTANKKIIHLRKIFDAAIDVYYPHLLNPLDIKGIESQDNSRKNPFTEAEIKILTEAIPKSNINEELKAIIFIAMHTGAGCKEIALLTSADIVLDAPTPFIRIGPNEHRTKVKHGGARHREVPLYGDALKWIKKFPNGFDRYRRDGGGEAISAAAKKFLKQYSNKPFYSFRHRIADLLRNSGCEDRLADAIMGHRQGQIGIHYGEGYSLETKLKALKKAFTEGSKNLERKQCINNDKRKAPINNRRGVQNADL